MQNQLDIFKFGWTMFGDWLLFPALLWLFSLSIECKGVSFSTKGDQVVSVNGQSVNGKSYSQVIELIVAR